MEKKFQLKLSDWTKVSIDTAKLLFEESNDYLSYTILLAEKITQRAYTFSIVIIAAIGSLMSKLLTIEVFNTFNCALFWLLVFSILTMFFLGILIAKIIFPYSINQKGRTPEKVGTQSYLAPEHLNREQAYLSFILAEIENIQNKIHCNEKINTIRLNQLKKLIYSLLVSFPIFVICYAFIFILFQ